jgi:hypothetical protein
LKTNLSIAFILLFCSVSLAEYKELEALKKSSRQVVAVYAQRLAAEDPRFEGMGFNRGI